MYGTSTINYVYLFKFVYLYYFLIYGYGNDSNFLIQNIQLDCLVSTLGWKRYT